MVDVKKVQKILRYLGYEITVDGIWGSQSEAALDAVLADAGIDEEPVFWKDIRYFRREEFRCPCGRCGGFPAEPKEKLVRLEDRVRAHFGAPVINSSGVRCAAHNAAVGGVANSRHLTGGAVDFCVLGIRADETLNYVKQQPETAYCYKIDHNFIHMDVI